MSEDLHDLAAAYALDAVDDLERAAFERHLPTCERCRTEVESYADAVLALATAPPEVEPPPSLKDAVLQQIQSDPQVTPSGRTARRRLGTGVTRALLAAAAVLVLAVTGVVLVQQRQEPTSVATLSPATRVLLAPDAQQRVAAVGEARLIVTVSRSEGAATVQSEQMPAAPAGRTYQAWYVESAGTPRSAGLMSGTGPQLLAGRPGSTLAITVEPAGGSPLPTTTPLVTVPLT